MTLISGKRGSTRSLVVPVLLAFLVMATSVAALDYAALIASHGTIKYPSAYSTFTITGVSGVYTGRNNNNPSQTTSGSNAATVITTVFGWMSPGQGVGFIGEFTLTSGITVSKDITLDFTEGSTSGLIGDQATVIGNTGTGVFLTISGAVTFLGGNFIGVTRPGIAINGASNSLFKGCFFQKIRTEVSGTYSTNIRWEYCTWHNTTAAYSYYIVFNYLGDHFYWDHCTFKDGIGSGGIGLFCNDDKGTANYAEITDCIFDNLGYHSIYLESNQEAIGNPQTDGHCIVAGNTFINMQGTNLAGVHLKVPSCLIYNNVFENWSATGYQYGYGVSAYGDYPNSNCYDNEIYNNTFKNIPLAIAIGSGPSEAPQLRNKVYNNTFINIPSINDGGAICLNLGSVSTQTNDTWIYFNRFYNCSLPFPPTDGSYSLVTNTVIAYNTFDATVPSSEQTALHSYVNTLIYGNTPWMADYPIPLPSPLPVPPPP